MPYDPNVYLQQPSNYLYPPHDAMSQVQMQAHQYPYIPVTNPYANAYSPPHPQSEMFYQQQMPPHIAPVQTFTQRRARAGTMGNIDVPINLQRQAQMLNPGLRNAPAYPWQAMDPQNPANGAYLGTGQGSGNNRRGSIQPPREDQQRRDTQAPYFSRWGHQ